MKKSNQLKKIIINSLMVLAILMPVLLAFSPHAYANPSPLEQNLDSVASGAGYNTDIKGESGLKTQIGVIIKFFLGFLGIVMIIIIIYAGFLWMTAGGEEDKVKKAQAWMKNAVIGIIIILLAYIIANFVTSDIGNKFLQTK